MPVRNVINREISWLSFNERVLQEAADPTVPLLERLKFLGIFSSNLEEFFRVRVATLQRLADAGITSHRMVYGNPKKVQQEIHEIVVEQRTRFDQVFGQVRDALEQENIHIIDETKLRPAHREFVQRYFSESVRPALVPVVLDTLAEFPYLKNGAIYLAVQFIHPRKAPHPRYALIEVSTDLLPRFIVLPPVGDHQYVIMLDDVIRFGLREIFSIFNFESAAAYTIKLTRDAEVEIDDDVTMSLMDKISKSIKKRKEGPPVRFVYDREIPRELLDFIMKRANLRKLDNAIAGGRYHNARDFTAFPRLGGGQLEYPPQPPIVHPGLQASSSVLSVVRKQDVLLHLPYHSFHPVIDLLREAAIDPKVRAIRITLYRVARDSRVVNALLAAVRNGKKVTALLELQARFDEEANIAWTRKLEEEGARLLGSVPNLKVHAKLALITRKEEGGLQDYAVVGTGNFNESTARVYADHFLLTADRRITGEVRKVFDLLETSYRKQTFRHLAVSPFDMRGVFTNLVNREIKFARQGKTATLDAKLNSLVDRDMIELLYAASRSGVRVRLIVRGTCSLVPGLAGVSENISAISIVDRYLEHSRIFFFGNGGDETCYLSSADWMIRNLDYRVEVAVPVLDPLIRAELRRYLDLQLADTTKARILNQRQDNRYREGEGAHRAQLEIYRWLARTASARGKNG